MNEMKSYAEKALRSVRRLSASLPRDAAPRTEVWQIHVTLARAVGELAQLQYEVEHGTVKTSGRPPQIGDPLPGREGV